MLVYDAASNALSGVSTAALQSKWSCACAARNTVIGFPYANGDRKLLVYGVVSGSRSGVSTSGFSETIGYWSRCATVGNKVIGMPCTNDILLVYDIDSAAVNGISVAGLYAGAADSGKCHTVLTVGNRVVGIPYGAKTFLIYDANSGAISIIPWTDDDHIEHDAAGIGNKLVCHLYAASANADELRIYDLTPVPTAATTTTSTSSSSTTSGSVTVPHHRLPAPQQPAPVRRRPLLHQALPRLPRPYPAAP